MECRPVRSETIALQDLLTNPTVNSLHFVAVCTDCLVLADKVSVLDDLKTSGALEASLVVNPAYGQSSHSWLWLSCRTDLRPHSLAGWSLFLVDRNYSGLHQFSSYNQISELFITFLTFLLHDLILLSRLIISFVPACLLHISCGENRHLCDELITEFYMYLFYFLYHQCKFSQSCL